MDKFIGFDVDHKHTLACVTQADRLPPATPERGCLMSFDRVEGAPCSAYAIEGSTRRIRDARRSCCP